MTERQIKLVVGSLLHDIGKIVYRSGDGRNHSKSGYEYLKNDAKIDDPDILNCIRYHHGVQLKDASIQDDSLAYITYYADNVASAADRRDKMNPEPGFDKKVPLSSVFNILNGNNGKSHYRQQVLDVSKGVFYPTEDPVEMTEEFYKGIISQITDNLRGITYTEEYMNSLLAILEANLSYIPSSTSRKELEDISLYDHVKLTAAFALCIENYCRDRQDNNYRKRLFLESQKTYEEKMFLLYSMDISGIQGFIYTIGSQGALRGLRARSFYLEILMEHMIDTLLEELSLFRTNLIYSGGGHCYLLLPNTESVLKILEENEKKRNQWFMDTFGTALYVAGGYAPCSANDLRNVPKGSYSNLYLTMSKMISGKKAHRYEAEDIRRLNRGKRVGDRECTVCRRVDRVDEYGRCHVCASLEKMSGGILYQNFFAVTDKYSDDALPLPGGKYLTANTKENLMRKMTETGYIRSYGKNDTFTGLHLATKLWVGDYTTGDTFEEFAQKAEGVQRIGVLRADVDNLGRTIVQGFHRPDGDEQYVTLSRTATLSRQLSLFFKCYINYVLTNGSESCLKGSSKRNATIVYSGGDDIFLVGAWNEIIEVFMDLRRALEKFTQGTLTISAGIGMYRPGYPINIMAKETALLEEISKGMPGKDSITLFDKNNNYTWTEFQDEVIGEKFEIIKKFFDHSDERGKAFLYNLLELLRNSEEKIQMARFVYFLSRMEQEEKSGREQKEEYRLFSRKMYEWIREPNDRKQTITAMYLYAYLNRDKEVVQNEAG